MNTCESCISLQTYPDFSSIGSPKGRATAVTSVHCISANLSTNYNFFLERWVSPATAFRLLQILTEAQGKKDFTSDILYFFLVCRRFLWSYALVLSSATLHEKDPSPKRKKFRLE